MSSEKFIKNKQKILFFGNGIKLLRKRNGLTQTDIAAYIDIKKPAMSNIENGITDPSLSVVCTLSEVFGLTPEQVMAIGAGETVETKAIKEVQAAPRPDIIEPTQSKTENTSQSSDKRLIAQLEKHIEDLKEAHNAAMDEKNKYIEYLDARIENLKQKTTPEYAEKMIGLQQEQLDAIKAIINTTYGQTKASGDEIVTAIKQIGISVRKIRGEVHQIELAEKDAAHQREMADKDALLAEMHRRLTDLEKYKDDIKNDSDLVKTEVVTKLRLLVPNGNDNSNDNGNSQVA